MQPGRLWMGTGKRIFHVQKHRNLFHLDKERKAVVRWWGEEEMESLE